MPDTTRAPRTEATPTPQPPTPTRRTPGVSSAPGTPLAPSPTHPLTAGGTSGLSLTPGTPLAPSVRGTLESSLGLDLSTARVHPASEAASQLGARAFTFGNDVFLAPGEEASDLSLMAHEAAHIAQQQGRPAVQLTTLTAGAGQDALEIEADRAATAVLRGEATRVQGRTGQKQVQGQFGWIRRGARAVGRGVRAVGHAIAEVGAAVRDRVLNYIKEHARAIPGYDLLAFILGRDPITQTPVERSAINLIRGVVGLIPGGAAMFANLERANVIQRAGEWFSAEVAGLGFTWAMIRGLFQQAWDALSESDLLDPGGAWEKIRAIFSPPLIRLRDFAVAAGRKLLEFIFEGALALAGGAGQRVLAIFRRVGQVFGLIVNDPIGFLGNLVSSVKGGFERFAANIWEHLRTAIAEWLLGAMRGALTLPSRLDLMGIVSIILQIFGLTWQRLRDRLVRVLGEPAVRFLENAFDFLRILVTQGLAAAWQKILEFATGLTETVMDGIRSWITRSVVGAAVAKLVTMFNPVGAIIQAIITIYNTVMFFIERAQQIAALVESIVNSIDRIARGDVGGAIAFVERTMVRALSVLISFLARFVGLGNVANYVREIIQRVQAVVDRALDRVVTWITDRGKALLERAGLGGDPQQRLDQGLAAGQAAVNRFAGRRVGAMVLRPLLAAIRVRYRLRSLEVFAQSGEWMLRGETNPTGVKPTGVLATNEAAPSATTGLSRREAIPFIWFKHPNFYPATIKLPGLGEQEYRRDNPTSIPVGLGAGQRMPLGVLSRFWPSIGKTVQLVPEERGPTVEQFRAVLASYDFNWSTFEADHVQDLHYGGPDSPQNLWPMDASANKSAGARQSTQMVAYRDESGNVVSVQAGTLVGRWFVIASVQV